MENQATYPVGTVYRRKEKNRGVVEYTVEDVLKTFNSKGELVKIRYVVSHSFLGQLVYDYDVVVVTIQRALWDENNA